MQDGGSFAKAPIVMGGSQRVTEHCSSSSSSNNTIRDTAEIIGEIEGTPAVLPSVNCINLSISDDTCFSSSSTPSAVLSTQWVVFSSRHLIQHLKSQRIFCSLGEVSTGNTVLTGTWPCSSMVTVGLAVFWEVLDFFWGGELTGDIEGAGLVGVSKLCIAVTRVGLVNPEDWRKCRVSGQLEVQQCGCVSDSVTTMNWYHLPSIVINNTDNIKLLFINY